MKGCDFFTGNGGVVDPKFFGNRMECQKIRHTVPQLIVPDGGLADLAQAGEFFLRQSRLLTLHDAGELTDEEYALWKSKFPAFLGDFYDFRKQATGDGGVVDPEFFGNRMEREEIRHTVPQLIVPDGGYMRKFVEFISELHLSL